ncbi:MAG: cadherin, partial [Aquabacterium sp.]
MTVQVSDGSLTDTQAISVTVTAVNDNTPVITSNGGGASATITLAQNTAAVTTVVATDADLPAQALTYSIVGGADQALFTIDAGTGALSFLSAPSYASPADAGGDNVYDVVVQASDGSLADTQAIAVTIVPTNDYAPVFTSNGGGATASVNVAENATAVTTVTATDADLPAQTLTYSIVGGADQALFTINASTGALSFVSGRDHENTTDADADGVYEVTVQVSDGSLVDTQAISVTVTAVNDNAPAITSNGGGATASVSVAENTTSVTTVAATDADLPAQTLTYSILGGADQALFTINASTGALSFVSGRDHENATDADADGVYEVTVQVSDGSLTDTQSISVTVTAVNDNTPVITSNGGGATASINVAENATAVTTVTATDADLPAQTLTYSIVGGADQALFTINASTGALAFVSGRDRENATDADADGVYEVTVQVSDGSLTDTQAISVTVTAVNDNTPVITSNGGGATASVNVAENATAVTTVTATDADLPAQTLTYSIVGGADQALFTINASTGALAFVSGRDREN